MVAGEGGREEERRRGGGHKGLEINLEEACISARQYRQRPPPPFRAVNIGPYAFQTNTYVCSTAPDYIHLFSDEIRRVGKHHQAGGTTSIYLGRAFIRAAGAADIGLGGLLIPGIISPTSPTLVGYFAIECPNDDDSSKGSKGGGGQAGGGR